MMYWAYRYSTLLEFAGHSSPNGYGIPSFHEIIPCGPEKSRNLKHRSSLSKAELIRDRTLIAIMNCHRKFDPKKSGNV